jgi:hypothetical protein
MLERVWITAVAGTEAVVRAIPVSMSAPSKITKLLVNPVSAVPPLNALATEPPLERVFLLKGDDPVLITALLMEEAHTRDPGAVEEAAWTETWIDA